MKAFDTQLRASLETMRSASGKLRKGYFYTGPADFVLREGQFFRPKPLSRQTCRLEIRRCFENARLVSTAYGFPYVEGYALHESKIPLLHAWNLGNDGSVIDTTWRPVGRAYLGVVFSAIEMAKWRGSLIDNWKNGWPLLRKHLR
jgi:hypothetical protein